MVQVSLSKRYGPFASLHKLYPIKQTRRCHIYTFCIFELQILSLCALERRQLFSILPSSMLVITLERPKCFRIFKEGICKRDKTNVLTIRIKVRHEVLCECMNWRMDICLILSSLTLIGTQNAYCAHRFKFQLYNRPSIESGQIRDKHSESLIESSTLL